MMIYKIIFSVILVKYLKLIIIKDTIDLLLHNKSHMLISVDTTQQHQNSQTNLLANSSFYRKISLASSEHPINNSPPL